MVPVALPGVSVKLYLSAKFATHFQAGARGARKPAVSALPGKGPRPLSPRWWRLPNPECII